MRIFVECTEGCIKAFHILDGTMPFTLVPLSTIVCTFGFLTNFLPDFVKQESEICAPYGKCSIVHAYYCCNV